MSKSDSWESGLLLLIFNGTAFTGIAQNHATPSDLYLGLHVADPGDTGTRTTSPANYPGYAVKQLARTTANFTVSGSTVSFVANQDFPTSTGAGTTMTHWSLSNSAGTILYYGAISPTIPVAASGVPPRINAGVIVTEG